MGEKFSECRRGQSSEIEGIFSRVRDFANVPLVIKAGQKISALKAQRAIKMQHVGFDTL